jgi:hypothetical protein
MALLQLQLQLQLLLLLLTCRTKYSLRAQSCCMHAWPGPGPGPDACAEKHRPSAPGRQSDPSVSRFGARAKETGLSSGSVCNAASEVGARSTLPGSSEICGTSDRGFGCGEATPTQQPPL